MQRCTFCEIARGRAPARVVHRDELAVAFEDAAPQAPVHLLVIPVRHIESLAETTEADEPLLGHLLAVAVEVARQRGLCERGFRTVINTRPEAGQSVFHLHVHVLGGRRMRWPPG